MSRPKIHKISSLTHGQMSKKLEKMHKDKKVQSSWVSGGWTKEGLIRYDINFILKEKKND